MPDAARLVAALSLAAVAYVLSGPVMTVFVDMFGQTNFGWFVVVNVVIGLLVGWISVGPRAGRGLVSAITNGVTGVFLLVLWVLFVQACNEMTRLAMKNRYDDPFEAIAAVFQIGAEWGLILLNGQILLIMAVGAVVTGLLTEWASRTWR